MSKSFKIAGHRVTSATLADWDRDHSWHPFTVMQEYLDSEPLMIARGEGIRLQDTSGKWYLDGCSSIWLNLHGHNQPDINQAVIDQLGLVAHATTLGQANIPATILARELTQLVPQGLNRVQFSDCGATAIEIAVKIAIQYWAQQDKPGKRQIIGFHDNYHGDTFGAMSIAPSQLFHKPFLDLLPYNARLTYPRCIDVPYVESGTQGSVNMVEPVERYLQEHAEEVAAVVIEPVEGAGGMIPAQPGFLYQLKSTCRRHDILLIIDEIATGFGHTGHLFACEAEQAQPDILCLGKALTGGYLPVAATLTTEEIYRAFLGPPEAMRTLYHGHSYAGNPLGCAAALASIERLPDLLPTLRAKVEHIATYRSRMEQIAIVEEVRHRGLMLGLPLSAPNSNDPARWDGWALRRLAFDVMLEARALGLLLRPIGNVVILLPSPSASLDELTEMLELLVQAIATVCERHQDAH